MVKFSDTDEGNGLNFINGSWPFGKMSLYQIRIDKVTYKSWMFVKYKANFNSGTYLKYFLN